MGNPELHRIQVENTGKPTSNWKLQNYDRYGFVFGCFLSNVSVYAFGEAEFRFNWIRRSCVLNFPQCTRIQKWPLHLCYVCVTQIPLLQEEPFLFPRKFCIKMKLKVFEIITTASLKRVVWDIKIFPCVHQNTPWRHWLKHMLSPLQTIFVERNV